MDPRERYARLWDRATSPGSTNLGVTTIYRFDKYCRHCGAGLSAPKPYGNPDYRRAYRRSFCDSTCQELGPRRKTSAPTPPAPPQHTNRIYPAEELAFAGAALDRLEARHDPMRTLVQQVDLSFRLLTEKLRYLECATGQAWSSSRFYRVLNAL